ncbi:hypothetical protein SDC9_115047 [bioreactor metagenome]|uniref:Uncharacterized protein n=1 Tax=bioreactor metagenome TaxID=1076179 RepID=A0A645BRW8_9ZZZZ|nr:hypothetical protein [Oscillospiraceae bacterium]
MVKKRKWTVASAFAYITKVDEGKIKKGLTYCSAFDFILKHLKDGEKDAED